jgi:hypothetical protein
LKDCIDDAVDVTGHAHSRTANTSRRSGTERQYIVQ